MKKTGRFDLPGFLFSPAVQSQTPDILDFYSFRFKFRQLKFTCNYCAMDAKWNT
jgi:hypothetical protein